MEGTCVRCGLPLSDTDTFCGSCGQPVTDATAATTQVPTTLAPGSPAPPGRGTPPPRPPGDNSARHNWPSYPGPSGPATPPVAPDGTPGQLTINEYYLGQRLLYDKVPEGSFDPLSNWRLITQFAVRAYLFTVAWLAGGAVAAIVLLVVALIGLGFGAAITLWLIGGVLVWLILVIAFLLLPQPVQLSEWKLSLDGKAAAAPMIFDHIAWALQRRQTPLDLVQVRRLRLAGGESRDYLEVQRSLFYGLICAFAYGHDLYVGWTFWLRIAPGRLLLMTLARLGQTMTHRGTDVYISLRYDYARAMREAIHNAAREGVEVAIGQTRAQGQNMGQSLQVSVTDVSE
jgi:hypothetical protein